MIEAEDLVQAEIKAKKIGQSEEIAYQASKTDELKWTLKAIERVFEIEDDLLRNGVELFSRFISIEEAESLLSHESID